MNRQKSVLILISLTLILILHYTPFFTTLNTTYSIQHQLNTTTHQATITLADTTYTQPLTISTPLTLQGTTHTTLNVTSAPNSYALHITTSHVTIQNLIIENHGTGLYTTGIKITADHVTIQNCTIKNTPVGIAIWANNILIDSCTFENCEDEGIALLGSPQRIIHNTTITNCTFTNNCDGVELQNAEHTTIQNCEFTQQTHAAIDAIGRQNTNTLIKNCDMKNNQVFDIYLANSENTTIIDSAYDTDSLYEYKSSNTQILQSNKPKPSTNTYKSNFNINQYLIQLIERIQEKITLWQTQINSITTKLRTKI